MILDAPKLAVNISPHSGSWAVWLGGANDEIATIEQRLAVPPAAPVLAYWHWIASQEFACGNDVASVLVDHTPVATYGLCNPTETGNWALYTVDLSAFTRQTVALQIPVETNVILNGNLFIDDVYFRSA